MARRPGPASAPGAAGTEETPTARTAWLEALALTSLSGILLWISFPPAEFYPAAWVALVPWLVSIARAPVRVTLATSAAVGYVLYVALLYWLDQVTTAGWLALAFYCMLYWPVAALVLERLRRMGWPFTIGAPLALVAWEYGRSNLLTGFPFLLVAHTQYRAVGIIQVADLAGVYGVTFLIGMTNGLISDLVLDRFRRSRRNLWRLFATCALLLLALLYGRLSLVSEARTADHAERVRLLLVQANIPISLKHAPSESQQLENLRKHVALSLQAKGFGPDLVIWPETMLPRWLNVAYDERWMKFLSEHDEYGEHHRLLVATRQSVEETCRETGAWVLVGSESYDIPTQRRWNSAYLLSPEGEVIGRYDKIHLVAFGEYTPLGEVFPFLRKLRPPEMGPDLTPGVLRRLFVLPLRSGVSSRFGVTICYEDSVATLFRRFVRDGAGFMVNITNDGWFGNTTELDLHLAVAVFRAVENRIALARAANTGISAIISPGGRIIHELVRNGQHREVEGTLCAEIPLAHWPSVYTRYGDAFAWLCLVALGALPVVAYLRRGRSEKSSRAAK